MSEPMELSNSFNPESETQSYPDYVKEIGSSGILVSRDGKFIYDKNRNKVIESREYRHKTQYYLMLSRSIKLSNITIRYVHQAVTLAWEPESYVGKLQPQVHHCDFNKLNNDIDNLIVLDKPVHIKLHSIIGKSPVSKPVIKELERCGELMWNWLGESWTDEPAEPAVPEHLDLDLNNLSEELSN